MAADRVWDEAERLVAAAITAVSAATRGMSAGGSSFATGSPECCVCPVCRIIAAMRDPSADLADRLTTGVSDLATGVASMLRNLAGGQGDRRDEQEPAAEGDEFWESLRRRAADEAKARATYSGASTVATDRSATAAGGSRRSTEDDPWRVATLADEDDADVPSPSPPAPRPMAKKVARKAVRAAAPEADSADARRVAAQAARAERAVPAQPPARGAAVTKKAVTKKAVAKKAVAKKAVRKAAASQEEPS